MVTTRAKTRTIIRSVRIVQKAVTVDSFGFRFAFLKALANSFSMPDIGTFRTKASINPANTGVISRKIPTAKSATYIKVLQPDEQNNPEGYKQKGFLKGLFHIPSAPVQFVVTSIKQALYLFLSPRQASAQGRRYPKRLYRSDISSGTIPFYHDFRIFQR